MQTSTRSGVVLLAAFITTSACGGSEVTSPTTPSVTRPAAQPSITLTGQVTDSATLTPIAGATVGINGRYSTTTDSSGNYSLTGVLDLGASSTTSVTIEGYESDHRFIRTSVQNARLHRIERIVAGESKLVTIAPDDTLCVNNVQDFPGATQDYVCRSVRVVAPFSGVMRLEARSASQGGLAVLEAETRNVAPCCSERLQNPTLIQVRAGTEVVANVEMPLGTVSSQSFTLITSMAPQ